MKIMTTMDTASTVTAATIITMTTTTNIMTTIIMNMMNTITASRYTERHPKAMRNSR